MLVMNQRNDPVTPIGAAELVLERLGRSARLVQQNGDGHCVIGECGTKVGDSWAMADSSRSFVRSFARSILQVKLHSAPPRSYVVTYFLSLLAWYRPLTAFFSPDSGLPPLGRVTF